MKSNVRSMQASGQGLGRVPGRRFDGQRYLARLLYFRLRPADGTSTAGASKKGALDGAIGTAPRLWTRQRKHLKLRNSHDLGQTCFLLMPIAQTMGPKPVSAENTHIPP